MTRLVLTLAALLHTFVNAALADPAKTGKVTPLFADDEVLQITLTAPFSTLKRNSSLDPTKYAARLDLGGDSPETHAIEISARGKTRRNLDICSFPPLRIRFDAKPEKGSLFKKQRKLKLVTHCRKASRYQQYYLLEYTAYKLFNEITPQSFNVRLAQISYVDVKNDREVAKRYGFFIEDVDDLARRVGKKEVDFPAITRRQLSADVAEVTLFQYLIGNQDWSVLKNHEGAECCHNGKLIGADKTANHDLAPVPYDFDYSGLVDTPYAVPPKISSARTVRRRAFRGFCDFNDQTLSAVAKFHTLRDNFNAQLNATPGLTKATRKKAQKYLDSFFKDTKDEQSIERKLLKKCR